MKFIKFIIWLDLILVGPLMALIVLLTVIDPLNDYGAGTLFFAMLMLPLTILAIVFVVIKKLFLRARKNRPYGRQLVSNFHLE